MSCYGKSSSKPTFLGHGPFFSACFIYACKDGLNQPSAKYTQYKNYQWSSNSKQLQINDEKLFTHT